MERAWRGGRDTLRVIAFALDRTDHVAEYEREYWYDQGGNRLVMRESNPVRRQEAGKGASERQPAWINGSAALGRVLFCGGAVFPGLTPLGCLLSPRPRLEEEHLSCHGTWAIECEDSEGRGEPRSHGATKPQSHEATKA